MRVRASSRASQTALDATHTVGNVPVRCNRFIPLASSLSLLLTLPIINLADRALTNCGFPPPASISSTTQYQLPTVSTATEQPGVHRPMKFLMHPRLCASRLAYSSRPSLSSTRAQVYFL